MSTRPIFAAAAALLLAGHAEAGAWVCGKAPCGESYAGSTYSAAQCKPPEEPHIRVHNEINYGSVSKKVDAFIGAQTAYAQCAYNEAVADQMAIPASAPSDRQSDMRAAIETYVKDLQSLTAFKIKEIAARLDDARDKMEAAGGDTTSKSAQMAPSARSSCRGSQTLDECFSAGGLVHQ